MALPLAILTALADSQQPGGVGEVVREVRGTPSARILETVAAGGDLDGDGFGDYAVGFIQPVRVTVYSGLTGAERWTVPISGANSTIRSESLQIVPDVNGDALADVLLGDVANHAVRMLSGADGSPIWEHEDPNLEWLGSCVDGRGDVDGDGCADVVSFAGAARHPNGQYPPGACVVLSGRDGALLHLRYVKTFYDLFTCGRIMASAGDLDADGHAEFMVGTEYDAAGSGVHLYSGRTGALLRVIQGPRTVFGSCVANAGDVDGDGVPDQAIAEPFGREVFLHSGADGSLIRTVRSPADASSYSRFGIALDGGRDLDGDAVPDLLVGDSHYREFGVDRRGAVFSASGADGRIMSVHRGPFGNTCGTNAAFFASDPVPETPPCFLFGGYAEWMKDPRPDGFATIATWHAGLRVSAQEVSAAAGTHLLFLVEFPASAAGQGYSLLVSRSGIGPTIVHGVHVPLTFDRWTESMHRNPPSVLHGGKGRLDTLGDARATLRIPPGAATAWAGSSLWVAAVTGAGTLPDASSVAREIRFLP